MHNVDMWNSELGTIVMVLKEKKGKKIFKRFSPKPASMWRLSSVIFRMQVRGEAYCSPFLGEGCVGWSSRSKIGH